MELHNLVSISEKSHKRVGRGHGSGRVKTSGRGTKGQKAKRDIPLHFEGGALPLIKRLPFLKGRGKNKTVKANPVIINLSALESLPAKSTIDIETLVKNKKVKLAEVEGRGIKILGNGPLTKAFTVKLPVSLGAKTQIEKAGGSVEL